MHPFQRPWTWFLPLLVLYRFCHCILFKDFDYSIPSLQDHERCTWPPGDQRWDLLCSLEALPSLRCRPWDVNLRLKHCNLVKMENNMQRRAMHHYSYSFKDDVPLTHMMNKCLYNHYVRTSALHPMFFKDDGFNSVTHTWQWRCPAIMPTQIGVDVKWL